MSRTAIAAVNRQFEEAAKKGDLDRLAALYTADAMAFPPDGPIVKGRENIKNMWGAVATQMGLKEVRLETLDLEQAGDTAYEAVKPPSRTAGAQPLRSSSSSGRWSMASGDFTATSGTPRAHSGTGCGIGLLARRADLEKVECC
jgi:uncharacterized protein (TIGR02246 family)